MDTTPPPPIPDVTKKRGLSTGCIVALVLGVIALVILGIVGVLVAVSIPTGRVVLQKARALEAKSDLSSIVMGAKGYAIEYNRLPVTDGESAPLRSEGEWLEALLGNEPNLNPRKISFVELPPAKAGAGGLTALGAGHVMLDPWGHPYVFLMDTNGDGMISDPEKPGSKLTSSVIGWSAGPDGDYDTWADNVVSWR